MATVIVSLANPLSAADANRIGLSPARDYAVGESIAVDPFWVTPLRRAGYIALDPVAPSSGSGGGGSGGSSVPLAHAASHAVSGSDPVSLDQSQVSGLVSALTGKASASSVNAALAVKADLVAGKVPASQLPTTTGSGGGSTNASDLSSGTLDYARLPAGVTITVVKSGSTWPARPTSRSDIIVRWKGADPSPAIVSSGTTGMLDGVDVREIPAT